MWSILSSIDSSRVVLGFTSMVFNYGSRFVLGDLTPMQQRIFQHPLMKRFVIWCMFFVITRHASLSVCLTVAAIVVLDLLLNEKSRYCLISLPVVPTAVQRTLWNQHPHPHHKAESTVDMVELTAS